MRSLSKAILLLGYCYLSWANAADQEDLTNLSLEELLKVDVISANRLGQKLNQAPTSMSVWTAGDIRTFGWRTLSEALNAMRGLFTSNDRNYSYVGVQGFSQSFDYNSRVLFMIDGQRMNENIYDGGYMAQEFMLDMDMVERIEFIPGAGASIYGANAFSGLINIITKTGHAINGTQLAAEGGSYDTYKGRISYGKKLENGTDVLVSASHYDSAGVPSLSYPEFNNPANPLSANKGVAKYSDAEYADRLFGRATFQEFTVMGGYVGRLKQIPTGSFGVNFNDPNNRSNDQQFFGNVKYQKDLSSKTSIMLKGSYQGYDYSAVSPYSTPTVLNMEGASGRWWTGNAQLTSTVFNRQRLLMGLEYQYDQRQHIYNYDILPHQNYYDTRNNGSRVQLYTQDDIQLLDNLVFSAGGRFDYSHLMKNLQINPRLGLIWNPRENTTYKLLYSTTFRAPNIWENTYNIGLVANPTNLEENIKTYEGIVEWRLSSGLKLMGNLFYNDIYQILQTANTSNGDIVTNDGHYHTRGAELEAEQRWNEGRMLKFSYTYNLLTDANHANVWGYGSPQNMFKLHYAEPLFNNFATLGVENVYIGDRKALQGGLADAYNLINLSLSSDRLARGLFASVNLYNLLDTHYQMLGGTGSSDITQNILLMNGREFRVKLQFTF
ncbi:TonB-dependent receptor [Methylomonas sp. AM2-LC]|uniref:TonB-dependent receptor plug domain-containing protein n=1 Tax=Methylomonas sp. AM2-LC TaxID=3153301 RepID=UPI0032640B04